MKRSHPLLIATLIVALSALAPRQGAAQSDREPGNDRILWIDSTNHVQVADRTQGKPIDISLTLMLKEGPHGARAVLALRAHSGGTVFFHCPDSDCSMTLHAGNEMQTVRGCHEGGHGFWQGLKLDSTKFLVDALQHQETFRVTVPVFHGDSTSEVEFEFEGRRIPFKTTDRTEVCEYDLWEADVEPDWS